MSTAFRRRISLGGAKSKYNRSKKTLLGYVKKGRVKAYRPNGREIDLDDEDLEAMFNTPYKPVPFSGERFQKTKAGR